ncbi:phage tail protein [Lacticaseibacillus rhamnosus]|uniref:distal tail protein Dit n=1 Tax=Lacticaseibacillus rhamnosus TaxID=47715 RepID=UPI000979A463|nr:distal tail protein Dit [Lacticaseibacillus rhamnosus]AQG71454.1 phage tail protein [Lacticaseibacillus rhamnosus]
MANLIFGGHKIGSSSLQFSAARGIFSEVENTTQPVGTSDGEMLVRSHLKPRIIPVTYDFVALSRREFERQLAPLLYSTDVQKLIIDDRPDEFWYAKVDGKIDMDRAYFLGTGTINFLVPDGIAHSVATKTFDNMPYKDVPVNLLTGTSYMATAESVPKGAFKASNAKTVSVSSGETYTYSIEIPSNNTVDLEAAINLNSKGVFVRFVIGNVIKAGESGISTITLTVPDGIDSLFLAVSLTTVNPNSATTIYEAGEKLELGTTASPWSPNPADAAYYNNELTIDNQGTYKTAPVITATMHGDNGVIALVNDQGAVLQFGSPSEIDGVVRQKSERVYHYDFESEPTGITMNAGALTYPNYRDNPSTPNKQKGIFSYGRPDGYDNAIAYPNTERNPSNYWSGPSMSGKLAANSNGKQNGNFEWRNLIRFATMTNWAGRVEFNLTYEGKIVASLALYDQSTTDDQVMFEGKIHDGNDARMLFHEALPRDLYSRANSFAVISKMGDQLTFRIDRVGGGNVIRPFTIAGFGALPVDGWTVWFSAFSDVLEANMGWQDSYFDWVNVDYWTDVPNRFKEGDVVKIDVAKRVVSLNGAEDPTLQTVGNNWEGFQLLPGKNTIQVLQSDWAKPYTCQVEWQEAWL